MKIKKVDDKPMVIHTKKKAKLHTHEPKKASIKAANIYTVDRSPKIKGAKISTTENKKFRRSTIHLVDKAKKGMFRQYRAALKESKQSIKTKNSSIKVAGAAGAQTALSLMEGGEKVRDAANITSNRCYRKAHNFDYCYEEIEKNLGKMYDPIVGIDVLDNWDEITSVVNR